MKMKSLCNIEPKEKVSHRGSVAAREANHVTKVLWFASPNNGIGPPPCAANTAGCEDDGASLLLPGGFNIFSRAAPHFT